MGRRREHRAGDETGEGFAQSTRARVAGNTPRPGAAHNEAYGSAIKDGIDWANFGGVTLAALVPVLLAVLGFRRRDIYT
jgi:hypothetical protein